MKTNLLLAKLERAARQLLTTVHTELEPLELAQLNQQPAPGAWSILECLEHLNRYSRYYLPQLAKAVAQPGTAQPEVRYSWLGRKFIAMMAPNNPKKAKTFERMNPSGSRLGREVLTEFSEHQQQLLEVLAKGQRADLNRKAVPVEFLKLLKMRLGEALEFVVLHQERHLQQALRAKASLGLTAPAQGRLALVASM